MTPWAASFLMGGRLALCRLGGRVALLITLGAVVFSTLAAWAERHENPVAAADFTLCGAVFGLVIPVATFSLVAVALSRGRLGEAVQSITSLGGNRRAASAGALFATSFATGMLGLLTATSATMVAHGQVDGQSTLDAFTAAWIGGLTGFVYAFFYGAASTIGKRGGMRIIFFVADLVLGRMVGPTAVVFPRAHSLNLLGAEPVLELPQFVSVGILVAMAILLAIGASLRSPS